MTVSNEDISTLPTEMLNIIFMNLSPSQLHTCSAVSKSWQIIANQNSLWKRFVQEPYWKERDLKQIYIRLSKEQFILQFPEEMIEGLGGLEEVKKIAYLNLEGIRGVPPLHPDKPWLHAANGCIHIKECATDKAIGKFYGLETSLISKEDWSEKDIKHYAFVATKFDISDNDRHHKILKIWKFDLARPLSHYPLTELIGVGTE